MMDEPQDVGYFSVREMQALAKGVSQGDEGDIYMTQAELEGLRSGHATYLSIETLRSLTKGTSEDIYMTVAQAQGQDDTYMTVEALRARGESGEGIYMTVEATRGLLDGGYLSVDHMRQLACGDGGYMSLEALRAVIGDAGYMDLRQAARDAGYHEVEQDGEGTYMELPEVGLYMDLPSPDNVLYMDLPVDEDPEFHSITVNGMFTKAQLKKLEKLRRKRAKELERDKRQGQIDRANLLKTQLKTENKTKRMTHKERVQYEKQQAKERKKLESQQKKEAKKAEKQALKEAKRRMSESKKKLKASQKTKKKKTAEELAAEREEMTKMLSAVATAAQALDGEEAAALWRAEPEETRYVAQKRHVTTGGGFLAFEAKDLLIVTKRDDNGFYYGRCIRTGKQGSFPADYVAKAS